MNICGVKLILDVTPSKSLVSSIQLILLIPINAQLRSPNNTDLPTLALLGLPALTTAGKKLRR